MNFFKAFVQANRTNRLAKLEKKRANIRKQRDRLKWQAQVVRREYEECLMEIKKDLQASPPGTVIAPASIPSSEEFGEIGK